MIVRPIAVASIASVIVALVAAAPAAAAVPGVQVSRDGVTYGNILAAPVFSTTPNLVPNGSGAGDVLAEERVAGADNAAHRRCEHHPDR